MAEEKITKEQLDKEIGGEFYGEGLYRVYGHGGSYRLEIAFSNGARLLKVEAGSSNEEDSGINYLARIMQDRLVESTNSVTKMLLERLALVCGESIPVPELWEDCGEAVKEIRRVCALAILENFEVYKMIASPSKDREWD